MKITFPALHEKWHVNKLVFHIPTLVTVPSVTLMPWLWNPASNAELSKHISLASLSFTMMLHLCRLVNENLNAILSKRKLSSMWKFLLSSVCINVCKYVNLIKLATLMQCFLHSIFNIVSWNFKRKLIWIKATNKCKDKFGQAK